MISSLRNSEFELSCSLIELFAEGQAPFDFAQLLAYRSQEISGTPVLEKIEDRDIRVNLDQHSQSGFYKSLIVSWIGIPREYDWSESGETKSSGKLSPRATRKNLHHFFLLFFVRVHARFDSATVGSVGSKNWQVLKFLTHKHFDIKNKLRMHRDLPELVETLKADGTLILIANIVLSSLRLDLYLKFRRIT